MANDRRDRADPGRGGQRTRRRRVPRARGGSAGRPRALVLLALGAVLFLFPFYYMLIGSLQAEPDTVARRRVPDRRLDPEQLREINGRIDLAQSLVNSGIFTGGVILVHGRLRAARRLRAGACCSSAAAATLFAAMLLVQVVPFQLLMIPLYVLIVRNYGLADTYLGMILPFAINSTAVFIFRQFFLQLPEELFDAARIDGASELRILLVHRAAAGAAGAAHRGPAHLHRSVERVPVAVPDHQGRRHAAARGVAGQLHQQRGRPGHQPVRRDPRRRRRAGGARRGAVHRLPAALHLHRHRLRREGMTVPPSTTTVPYPLTRLGVVMTPEPGDPLEAAGRAEPGQRPRPRTARLYLLPRIVAAGNVSRVGLAEVVLRDGVPVGVERRGVVLAPDEGWERGAEQRRRRGPAHHLDPEPRAARDDLRRLRPARAAAGARRLRATSRAGDGSARCSSATSPTSTPT